MRKPRETKTELKQRQQQEWIHQQLATDDDHGLGCQRNEKNQIVDRYLRTYNTHVYYFSTV